MRLLTRATCSSLLAVASLSLAVPLAAQEKVDVATIERIKTEAMQHSQVMDILSYLTDVYGPRLTWSPNARAAADWTVAEMKKWGIADARLEPWDTPNGIGWRNERFSLQAISPNPFIIAAAPRAWSAGTKGRVTGPAMRIEAGCFAELEQKYSGKLKNAFLMFTAPSPAPETEFTAYASRRSDSSLAAMAAPPTAPAAPGGGRNGRGGGTPPVLSPVCQQAATQAAAQASAAGRGGRGGARLFNVNNDTTALRWLEKQGPAAILMVGRGVGGDIGTDNGASRAKGAPQVPFVHVSTEGYGRVARMLERNVPVVLELEMINHFYPADSTSFNIVGDIPGTDPQLKDQVVMIGGHFDSWHSGTGATDNGAGAGVMLEAMRILKTLNLQPRRTIRIGLWTGEEEGLYGSCAYTRQHFGYVDSNSFHPTAEQGKLAAYFNLDNGSGKIRGVYDQGNAAVGPIFDAWMEPFKAIGMSMTTISNTGSTDHIAFDNLGLPGFQFVQDPLDYGTRTHHTNQDVYERLQPDDMMFNSAVLAAFAWQAAQRDEMLPRKPAPYAPDGPKSRGQFCL
jgi:carboxypeptidase Q